MCPIHSIQFLYYCIDCKAPLCSDCFMLEETHKNHSIKKMKIIYDTHRSNIRKEEDQLANQCIILNQYLKEINDKIIDIGNFKFKKGQELAETFDLLKKKLENNAHEVLSKLMTKKNSISEKLNDLDKGKRDIERKIAESSQSDLIKRSNDIITITKGLILKNTIDENIIDNNQLNLSKEIPSDYYAPYQSSTFQIDNFYNYIKAKDPQVIYSPGIRMNGIVWRLKVYPRGNTGSNFEYLSVFLELIEGNRNNIESTKYYYKIELINNENNKKNFYQEHSSDFIQGDCWGYNKFFKLEKIHRDGFINKLTDRITINFYVRPETFCQLSKDLMYYICLLEKKDSCTNSNSNKEVINNNNKLNKNDLVVKPKSKLSLIKNLNMNKNNNEDCFNLLSDESINANDRLSKSMRTDTQNNIKIAKELFEDADNNNDEDNNNNGLNNININAYINNKDDKKEEDIKEIILKKKENRYAKQKDNFCHQYMHTIDSDPILNINKFSKVNISPIQEKKSDQIAHLQKFQIDLSLDSQNEDDFKDFNFYIPKQVKSDSFNEESYEYLMESFKGKEEKEVIKNMNERKYNSNKKEEKNMMSSQGNNPFFNYPNNNNNSSASNTKYNPFLPYYKNVQYGNSNSNTNSNDVFKNLFEPKKSSNKNQNNNEP